MSLQPGRMKCLFKGPLAKGAVMWGITRVEQFERIRRDYHDEHMSIPALVGSRYTIGM